MPYSLLQLDLSRLIALCIFKNVSSLFSPDFANVQNNYDVERSDKPNDKVFYGMECTAPDVRAKVQSSTIASQPFGLKLIDRDDGNELLELSRTGLNDVPTVNLIIVFEHDHLTLACYGRDK
jgi:hypothetical protein